MSDRVAAPEATIDVLLIHLESVPVNSTEKVSPPLYPPARRLAAILIALAVLWTLFGKMDWLASPRRASAASDPVIAAAGDIACDPAESSYNGGNGTSTKCHEKYTSDLLANGGFDAVLALGDTQYYCGGYKAFLDVYDPTWGRVKSITHPAVGNHEYLTSGGTDCSSTRNAAGYFQYFGSAAGTSGQGYYSFNLGTWHIIALNSSCSEVGGCGTSSVEYKWLQSDLATDTSYCTLAFWHIPLFSSGGRATKNTQYFWQLLYQYDADVVLSGHDHDYERFAPQTASGAYDPVYGIREFVVGTGGESHTSISSLWPNSEVHNTNTFGVLKLALHPSSYDWQFVPQSGQTFTDSGTGSCHDASGLPSPTPTSSVANTATATATSALVPTPTATNTPGPTATPAPTATPTATASSGGSITFVPNADAYVNSSYPNTNYGTSTALRADASPIVNSYVRFTVSGLNGLPITKARLFFYMNSSSSAGMQALTVADSSWGETSITYSNAPPMGSTIATSSALTAGTWVVLDVTSYVTAEGTYSFGIITPGSTAISFASRESGANAPELVVDLGP